MNNFPKCTRYLGTGLAFSLKWGSEKDESPGKVLDDKINGFDITARLEGSWEKQKQSTQDTASSRASRSSSRDKCERWAHLPGKLSLPLHGGRGSPDMKGRPTMFKAPKSQSTACSTAFSSHTGWALTTSQTPWGSDYSYIPPAISDGV